MQKEPFFPEYQPVTPLTRHESSHLYLGLTRTSPATDVVIKVYTSMLPEKSAESGAFLQELDAFRKLSHPHLLPLLDGGACSWHPYVVSPYIASGSLRKRLLQGVLFPYDEMVTLVVQIGQVLSFLHAHGCLHDNLKSTNVVLGTQRSVLLTDRRFFRGMGRHSLHDKPDHYTAAYMAPERFTGHRSPLSDQYALGCLAYELLTGNVPFPALSFVNSKTRHLTDAPVPPGQLVHVPRHIESAILTALAKKPSQRYPTVNAFIEALVTVSPYMGRMSHVILPVIPGSQQDGDEQRRKEALLQPQLSQATLPMVAY